MFIHLKRDHSIYFCRCFYVTRRILFSFAIIFLGQMTLGGQTVYDIVLKGGRVMDPETGLDDIRNLGTIGDRIFEISTSELVGREVIDVSDLVVAPGFIDLHVHGMSNDAHVYQVRDGVTTALELEGGVPFLRHWLKEKSGNSIVNFGASASHGKVRAMAMKQYQHYIDQAREIIANQGLSSPEYTKLMLNLGRSNYQSLEPDDLERMHQAIDDALEAGALGIGVPVGYYPGASAEELLQVYSRAAKWQVPVFSHTRGFGMPGIHEAIANATVTGAPLHIVHANSLSLGEIQVTLDMVASAQSIGLDVTTEVYPYTAASTGLGTAIFDEGWQDQLGISYGDLQYEATGERLTEETFQKYREQGGTVIIHMMKPEWIIKGIQDKNTIIASDGMPYAPGAHPRTAGTFSRVLGRYVREKGTIPLMEAIQKMTLMPAQRLEQVAPAMRLKGRLQVGMDADITVFDPNTIIDRADFKGLKFSEGIHHVLVNGQLVVTEGENVDGVFPGRPIMGRYRK